MSSTLASVLFRRFVARSEEQELSVSPSGCPTYFSLRGQREVGKRKATPRPRPLRIPAQRVRVSPRVFVDSASLHCHEHRRHPCRRPFGLIRGLPPLPRGPVESAGSCPQEPKREARSEKREAAMWIGWALAHRGLDARACPSAPKPQRRAGPESPGPALRDLRAFTAPVLGASRGRAAHTRASASLPFGAANACFGLIHSRRVNQARATAPTLNTVSPGTRIHTSIWMIGCCIRSAERAYQ